MTEPGGISGLKCISDAPSVRAVATWLRIDYFNACAGPFGQPLNPLLRVGHAQADLIELKAVAALQDPS